MSIKLSICVPTYNRGNMLKQCLQSILSAENLVEKLKEENVEILISDNASVDNTQIIISEFKKTYPQIRYHRNQINIGGEKNFYLLAQMAKGEFIWILGDDDKVTTDSIQIILDHINGGYNMLITNYSIWSNDFLERIKRDALVFNKSVFIDANELMKCFGIHLGYISSVIIKRSLFLKTSIEEYEIFKDYGFPFLYAVYVGVLNDCNTRYISLPLVCNRAGNSGGYSWFKYFIIGSSKIFDKLETRGYLLDSIHEAKKTVIRDFLIYRIIDSKLLSTDEFKGNLRDMISYYKKHLHFWLICLPLLYTPKKIIVFLKKLKKYFN